MKKYETNTLKIGRTSPRYKEFSLIDGETNSFINGNNIYKTEFIYSDTTTICMIKIFFDSYHTVTETKMFKGIARLCEGDTYNRTKGEEIALDKALLKMGIYFQKLRKNIAYGMTHFECDMVNKIKNNHNKTKMIKG